MLIKSAKPLDADLEQHSAREQAAVGDRATQLRRAALLTGLTLGWNLIEGVVALTAARWSGSTALLGFGADSFVESASAGIMVWRVWAEYRAKSLDAVERIDEKARKLISLTLLGLAGYVSFEAVSRLLGREHPESSTTGLVLLVLSLGLMQWLARAKKRTAMALGSQALKADAAQTAACWLLSALALAGVVLNQVAGWWWADPVSALAIAIYLLREAREAWEGEEEHP